MKIRMHRGALADSMETVQEIEATLPAVVAVIEARLGMTFDPRLIEVSPYGGVDERIGWDTHIVTIRGYGVFGFTDGPLSAAAETPEEVKGQPIAGRR